MNIRRAWKTEEEFDQDMCERYPILYQQRHWTMDKTCMCWGFCVPEEWWPIIDNLSLKIELWNKAYPDKLVQAAQVKEKFGELRFYTDGCYPEVSNWIEEAERQVEELEEST